MSYKVIYITDESRLSLRNNSLRIVKDDIDADIHLDDISAVVMDGYKINISMSLINSLASHGISVITCDNKRLPVATLLPLEQHSRQKKMYDIQMAITTPFKKNIWQKIIKQKIQNQSDVLKILNKTDIKLEKISQSVMSGDSTGREAYSAKIYFSSLLDGGYRSHSSKINSCLDYAYAIVRSSIARSLAGYGFYTSIGVHHISELNQYNLADDMIEAYRPIIDLYVVSNADLELSSEDLSTGDRSILTQVLNMKVKINNESHTLNNAVEKSISSLRSSYNTKDYELLSLPTLCK